MTIKPETVREISDGTEALQDGWVNAAKAPRKSVVTVPSRITDSKKESEPWEKVQDGWDKDK